ncbi:hypothetical protein JCM10212_005927 [Sporobolomyces blumeae]
MAGANSKRIAAENAQVLQRIRLLLLISTVVYVAHLALFQSGRTTFRVFMFVMSETASLSIWQQLEGMAQRGQSLDGKGLVQYMFDIVYVTWATHMTTALISAKFWYLYWIIPLYAGYKLLVVAAPYISPSLAAILSGSSSSNTNNSNGRARNGGAKGSSSSSSTGGGPRSAADIQEGVTGEILSKRQEKLRKRAEKGDPRVMQASQGRR